MTDESRLSGYNEAIQHMRAEVGRLMAVRRDLAQSIGKEAHPALAAAISAQVVSCSQQLFYVESLIRTLEDRRP